MEKNGFIFIKQNFDMFDGPEPTLTEISDNDAAQVKNESSSSGPQTDIHAKNVVKIIDSGKTVRISNKRDAAKAVLQAMPKLKKYANNRGTQHEGKPVSGKSVNILGGKKRQNSVQTNTSNNTNSNVVLGLNGQLVTSKRSPMIVKPIQNSMGTAPMLVQLVQGSMIPLVANNGPIQLVPISLPTGMPLQSVLQPAQVLSQAGISDKGSQVTLTSTKLIGSDIDPKPLDAGSFNLPASYTCQALESQISSPFIPKVTSIDEKGDSGTCIQVNQGQPESTRDNRSCGQKLLQQQLLTATSVATPVVTDAPWQGVLNINSEQELLQYINSQSATGEKDKNIIFIQNVDSLGGQTTTSQTLDSQMLAGISGLGEGYVDQGLIMSDVLPTVSNVEEVHINQENAVTLTDNMTLLSEGADGVIPIRADEIHIVDGSHIVNGSNIGEGSHIVDNPHITDSPHIGQESHIVDNPHMEDDSHITDTSHIVESPHMAEHREHMVENLHMEDSSHIVNDSHISGNVNMEVNSQINDNTVVFSSVQGDIPETTLNMDNDSGNTDGEELQMIIITDPMEQTGENGNQNETVIQEGSSCEENEEQSYSNCESEQFREPVTLFEPTMVDDVNGSVNIEEQSSEIDHEATEENESGRKGLYTDHDFYSVPMAGEDVEHNVDHNHSPRESQCYDESVMLNNAGDEGLERSEIEEP